MKLDKLRWGILGVAHINDRLMPAFKASSTVDLRAIASRTLAKAEAAAKKDGIPIAFGSYEELLASKEIDAVYIPLPNNLHAEWAKKAADAGKHILCEKPLTPTAAEAAELVAYCHSKNVKLMDGFMWPHHPRTHKLRKYLDEGHIGDVVKVNTGFTFILEGLPTGNIRMKPEAGGGGLLDVGCYCIYAIRWWMKAEPVSVFAKATFVNGVDVAMSGVLAFEGGRTANFDCGFTEPLRTWVEIVGTKGVVKVPNQWIPDDFACFKASFPGSGFDSKDETIGTPGHNQMVHMLDDFAKAVRTNEPVYPDPMEAVKTLKVLDALSKSARSGKEERV